jgi:hypothetical protein
MDTHLHILIETQKPNLPEIKKIFSGLNCAPGNFMKMRRKSEVYRQTMIQYDNNVEKRSKNK